MWKIAKVSVVLIIIILISSIVIFQSATVKAQSKTIIVPDNYPTIISAIGNATNGDMIFVRSGTYLEHTIAINKSIALIGENAKSTIINCTDKPTITFEVLSTGGNAVTIDTDYVTISGFTIHSFSSNIYGGGLKTLIKANNLPDGLALISGVNQTVSDNHLSMIYSATPNAYIINNTFSGKGGDMITIEGGGSKTPSSFDSLLASGTIVFNNKLVSSTFYSAGAIHVDNSNGNIVANNEIANCYSGISVSGIGNTIVANTIANCSVGLATLLKTSNSNIFYNNNIENTTFASYLGGSKNLYYSNNFVNNSNASGTPNPVTFPLTQISINSWDNDTKGNYWSDYKGTDVTGDGIGDSPYVVDFNNSDFYPLMNPVSVDNLAVELPQWAVIQLSQLPTVNDGQHISQTDPFSTLTILVVVLIVIVAAFASLLLFIRHRKTAKLSK
jgi:nitrous oxidase accessory protein NosD